jgi:NADH-quinone oxidoreductase subunit N
LDLFNQLKQIQQDSTFFFPELILSVLFVVIILLGLIFKKQQSWLIPFIVFIGLSTVLLTEFEQLGMNKKLFSGMLSLHASAVYFKFLFAACGFLALGFSLLSNEINALKDKQLEYWGLIIAVLFGCHLLIMSVNFLMVFLSLEIVSVGSYILVALVQSKKTAEASLKYILFGMFASALMLYGISLLFGYTGIADFSEPAFAQGLSQIHYLPLLMGTGFFIAGVLFKISAFPFHLWTPDVYEGTPAPVIAFLSAATKVAGFGLLINCTPWIFKLEFGFIDQSIAFGLIALFTISIGNFSALLTNDFKRMLGYSAIAHSGFILLAFLNGSGSNDGFVFFYLLTYVPVNFLVFFLAEKLYEAKQTNTMTAFNGLGIQYPVWGVIMIIAAVSLTGIPPTAGFMAKLFIFGSVWEMFSSLSDRFYLFLFGFGLINTVVALFFYLKVPYVMFLRKADGEVVMSRSVLAYMYAGALSIILLLLFFRADVALKGIMAAFN